MGRGKNMTQNKTKKKSAYSLIKKLGLVIIGLFLLYVIAGFWVVPPLLKPRLEKELSSQIDRKVTIEEIKLNPLVLSATTTNLTVYEKDGEPFAGFKELLVDAELSSIVRWAVTFKEIRVLGPFGVLKVLPDKTLNISDILTKFSQPEPAPEEQAELPRAVLSKLQVEDGKFTVENLSGAEPVIETYSPINFSLANVSTLKENEGAYNFAGVGPLGGTYQLDGQLSVNPIRVQGSYSTTGTHLSQLWMHLKDQVSFQIKKGTIATSGNYLLELIDGTLEAKLQNGVFELKDFQLTEKGQDKVLISIPSFSVQGISADVDAREIVADQVKSADARIESWLTPDGILHLQRLFITDLQKLEQTQESGSTAPETAESSPWLATIRKIEVNNWGAVIEDRTLPNPARITVEDVTVSIENLETKKDSKAKVALALQINRAGTVKVNGTAGIYPLSADLEILSDKIALNSFQPYVDTAINAQIISGTTSSKGRILYQNKDDILQIKLQDGIFELNDFKLSEKGKEKVLVSIPSFSVEGISADVDAREIVVEQVKSTDARIESWIASDGTFNLQSLMIPDSQKSKKTPKKGSTKPETTKNSPWHAIIHKIEVNKWGAAMEDRTLPKPTRITIDDLTVRVENLENKKNSKAKVALALQINQAGTVKVNGTAGMDPLSADLEVLSDKIALKSFQPYVDTAINAQIISGTTSSKGRILYKGKEGQPQIRYQGELRLDDLEIRDNVKAEDFITKEQFKASGIVLDIHPNKLNVKDVVVDKLHASVTIDQNGTVNVIQAFTPIPDKGEKEKEDLIERLVNFLILQIKGPIPIKIDMARLKDLSVDLIDGSITPSYNTHLEISEGTMKGLSSDPSARADFKIEGTIDQSATIRSAGQMNPLNAMQYAKVDFSLKDFNLKPVSPYSSKYAGYKIAEGKLHLDLKYRVDDSTFTGDNKIFVDRLTLGDKADSPAATNLPVALGLAILKGGDGNIKLQVPISGNINDPQFDIGQIILSALTGAMTDVSILQTSATADSSQSSTATDSSQSPTVQDSVQSSTIPDSSAPSAIAKIDDVKGEEVHFIEFEFGLSELSEQATKKLDALTKFLNERTALTLGIEGTADRQMDLTKMSGKQANKEKPGSNQKAAKAQQKDPAKDQAIDDNQLKMLALTRANKVKDYLTRKVRIAAKRVQLKPAKIISITDKAHGRVELYLSEQ
jgi:outer membrane protein OmpA-like peptidoglycan-associated protein